LGRRSARSRLPGFKEVVKLRLVSFGLLFSFLACGGACAQELDADSDRVFVTPLKWERVAGAPHNEKLRYADGTLAILYLEGVYAEVTASFGFDSRLALLGTDIAVGGVGRKAIRAPDFKRDFDFRSHDLVSIAFDGFNDKRNAMTFVTNAFGVQRDLLSFDDLYYDIDWDGLWKVRTNRTDSGWTAELAIPWQTLRYPRTTDTIQQWGFNIYRNRRLSNEVSSFSPFPRIFSSQRMAYAGLLSNLRPPPPKPNIRVLPYVLGSYDHYKNFDTTIKSEQTNLKVGGDIKWAINPNAVLDLTANTDFAQADADQQINNVTRFSVFFPEKRQFFLENASLFGIGISPSDDGSGGFMRVQPFFSRSIGLDTAGNPIPIDAGGRFVYRSDKRNYGVIAMRQRETSTSPGTNFFVGRFS